METWKELVDDTRDFWMSGDIERVDCPSPLIFMKDFVAKNKPCIITGLMDTWPAMGLWNPAYVW